MVDIEQTELPGIGLRHDFPTRGGRRIGVLAHRDGRRDLLVYDRDDPDRCGQVVSLSGDEADALADLLGAPRIVERLTQLHDDVQGLMSERVELVPGSPYDGRTLGDTQARTRTGASIVAVMRDREVMASPTPDFTFLAGDVIIIVGTREGIAGVTDILHEG